MSLLKFVCQDFQVLRQLVFRLELFAQKYQVTSGVVKWNVTQVQPTSGHERRAISICGYPLNARLIAHGSFLPD